MTSTLATNRKEKDMYNFADERSMNTYVNSSLKIAKMKLLLFDG